jgi:hypothetical protein
MYIQGQKIEMSTQTNKRKLNWIGHILRKGHETIEREALNWNSQRKRNRGRHRHTWRRNVHNEALKGRPEVKLRGWPEYDQMAVFC